MPRNPVTIQQVYIADGFADDCDELIHRCSRVDILNYQTFCIYYKEMNFASVFQGRTSNAEIAELSEELIQIAKYYMVLDTSNFEPCLHRTHARPHASPEARERLAEARLPAARRARSRHASGVDTANHLLESVAGLFLVYALINLQPYPRFAALRLVPADLPALARVERVARRDRRHDVLHVLGSVLARGPTQCHVASRPRGMESSIRKYLEGFCNIDTTGVRPKGIYFRQNEELDIIRDMTGIFKRYSQAKGNIPGLQKRVLSYSNDNLALQLAASLKRVINGTVEDEGETSMDHHNSVQEIKKRAMQNIVATVRHLDSAETRKKSPEKKPKPTPPQTRAKISAKRPKKSVTSLKKVYSGSSSKEDFGGISNYGTQNVDKNEQEIYVEIDSLPPLITTESNGKLVEIEIIDEMKKKSPSPLPPLAKESGNLVEIEICDEIKQNDPLPRPITTKDGFVEIEICDETKSDASLATESDGKIEVETEKKKEDKPKKRGRRKKEDKKASDEAIFKTPLRVSPRLNPVLKRDQKKPILKSKFKKMGMLEVANFKVPK